MNNTKHLRWKVYEIHGIHGVNKTSLGKVAIIPLTLRSLFRYGLLGTLLGFGGGLLCVSTSCADGAGLAWLGSRSELYRRPLQGVSKSGVKEDSTCLVFMRVSAMMVRRQELTSMKFW